MSVSIDHLKQELRNARLLAEASRAKYEAELALLRSQLEAALSCAQRGQALSQPVPVQAAPIEPGPWHDYPPPIGIDPGVPVSALQALRTSPELVDTSTLMVVHDALSEALRLLIKRIEALEKDTKAMRGRVAMTYCGTWIDSAAYERGDAVTQGGSLWVAEDEASPGDRPGSAPSWRLAVKSGSVRRAEG